MDLKTTLLLSLSELKVLKRKVCINVNKKRYAIKYTVKGKMLQVVSIKRIRKKKSLNNEVLKKSRRFLRRIWYLRQRAAFKKSKIIKTTANTQTDEKNLIDISTETIKVAQIHKSIDPPDKFVVSTSTQTEISHSVTATQCRVRTLNSGVQTLNNVANIIIQTHIISYNKQTQTNCEDFIDMEKFHEEQEKVVILLQEICTTIFNQTHVLNNNSTLLKQLSQMAVRNVYHMEEKKQEEPKISNYQKIEKLRKPRRNIYTNMRGSRSFIKMIKQKENILKQEIEIFDKAQQTIPIDRKNKSTQTSCNYFKSPTLLQGFFKSTENNKRNVK